MYAFLCKKIYKVFVNVMQTLLYQEIKQRGKNPLRDHTLSLFSLIQYTLYLIFNDHILTII